jgi:hypothetical protein
MDSPAAAPEVKPQDIFTILKRILALLLVITALCQHTTVAGAAVMPADNTRLAVQHFEWAAESSSRGLNRKMLQGGGSTAGRHPGGIGITRNRNNIPDAQAGRGRHGRWGSHGVGAGPRIPDRIGHH